MAGLVLYFCGSPAVAGITGRSAESTRVSGSALEGSEELHQSTTFIATTFEPMKFCSSRVQQVNELSISVLLLEPDAPVIGANSETVRLPDQ